MEHNIDDIVVKDPATLTSEEKTFLETNKEQLTSIELTKFGLSDGGKGDSGVNNDDAAAAAAAAAASKKDSGVNNDDDDDDTDPEDKKRIAKEVSKLVDPVLKETREIKQNAAIATFVQANPDYAPYQNAIKGVMNQHPTLTAAQAASIAAGSDMMKIGARKERAAAAKARSTQGGGSSSRNNNQGGKDWGSATKEEFEAQRAKVLGRVGA